MAWIAGLRRLAAPVTAALTASLWSLAIVLPVVVAAARIAHVPAPPDAWVLVRADQWLAAVLDAGPGPRIAVLTLLGGTAAVFVVQELLPARRWRGGRWSIARTREPRLDASVQRVVAEIERRGLPARSGAPRIFALETGRPIAALHGFGDPVVLVSRGLLERFDDEELDCVVAHEIAHRMRGGNLVPLLVWLARVVQAASPAALVLYRGYVEAQERACDALAAQLTGRPAALADVLLKMHALQGHGAAPGAGAGPLRRSRREILRRAELAVTRARVRALLDAEVGGPAPRWAVAAAALVLGAMMWGIA